MTNREKTTNREKMAYREKMTNREKTYSRLGLSDLTIATAALLTFAGLSQAQQKVSDAAQTKTQVVLLGTGNPFPDPDRSGPATAIVVNGTAYLVDLGAGVVRRAKSAMFDKGGKLLWKFMGPRG
jgi:hypothetical protein